jgi:hypothetical protein
MFQLTTCLLLAALHASRTAAEVPETCQENYNGFSVTEDTYANQLVTFQVASYVIPAPSHYPIHVLVR